MSEKKSITLQSRINSFGFAIRGCLQLLKQEPNMRIHAIATVVVITAGIVKQLTLCEWVIIVIAIALVWITEALNTAIEMLCDLYCGGKYHQTVKSVKDISAAAVLMASVTSCIIGFIVFIR